jgi:hypothetical protein
LNVSLDPGRAPETDRREDLLEMYRTAIEYLDSLHDPAVQPLRAELSMLERRLAGDESAERLH